MRETVFDGVLKACIIWCVSHVTFREMHGMILYILPPASYLLLIRHVKAKVKKMCSYKNYHTRETGKGERKTSLFLD